jgi:type IV pilus assembly protein PilB
MRQTSVIDLNNRETIARALSVRRLVYLVLLLAIRDRATDVEFEPSPPDGLWKIRYRVDGVWYEMVPVPLHVPVSQEIQRLAGMHFGRHPLTYLGQVVTTIAGRVMCRAGYIRLHVGGQAIDIAVTIQPTRARDARGRELAVLCLPKGPLPTAVARRLLLDYLREQPPREEQSAGGR